MHRREGQAEGKGDGKTPNNIWCAGGNIVTIVPLVLISKVSIVSEYLRNYVETLVIALVCGIYWILETHNCF